LRWAFRGGICCVLVHAHDLRWACRDGICCVLMHAHDLNSLGWANASQAAKVLRRGHKREEGASVVKVHMVIAIIKHAPTHIHTHTHMHTHAHTLCRLF